MRLEVVSQSISGFLQLDTATAWCSPNEVVLGGGVGPMSSASHVRASRPVTDQTSQLQGWQGQFVVNAAFPPPNTTYKVYAVCARAY